MLAENGRGGNMRGSTIAGALVACGLLIGLTLPVASLAQPGGPGGDRMHRRGHGPERMIERYGDQLGLSSETRAAIQQVIDKSRDRGEAMREELRAEHEAMHDLLKQPLPDESAVMAQAEAISAMELSAKKNRLKAMIAIHGLLTPEQRDELVAIRAEGEARRKARPMSSCREDLANLCPEAEPGHAMLECLSGNWEGLSEDCQGSFERGPRSGFGPRHRPGSPRY
jgi:Spy/CpxP family protein refolding chaperone